MEHALRDWFEDDAFWIASYPFMFPDEGLVSAAEDATKIVALSGADGTAVLDLCCGPGRHAVPLARQGFQVTGVDRTAFLLDKAHDYAAKEKVDVEFVLEDMRCFARPNHFDLALNLCSSFGYFDDASDNDRVLQAVFTSLKPNGVFVLELAGRENLLALQAMGSQELPNGDVLVQKRTVHDDESKLVTEWFLFQNGDGHCYQVSHWLYSGHELKAMLEHAGFAHVALYGGLDGEAYGPDAGRVIAVARKGDEE